MLGWVFRADGAGGAGGNVEFRAGRSERFAEGYSITME
jgi:hypothetical protein